MIPECYDAAERRAFVRCRKEMSGDEWHILAISQAICLYRKEQRIDGPLFLGMDTHALSVPARPSGTENIYKIYAESFRGQDHLRRILDEAQTIVNDALSAVKPPLRSSLPWSGQTG